MIKAFKLFPFFIFFLCVSEFLQGQEKYTVNGTISDSLSGESTIGALVFIKGSSIGVSTNEYGFYSLTLVKGEYTFTISALGYKDRTITLNLQQNTSLNIKIAPDNNVLDEVIITATDDKEKEEIRSTQMSVINIPIEQIKNIPTIGGETDVIKVLQLMPGIKQGSEGQNTMLVRGGNGDDNLILMDEATVYNVSHLFGFFSVFNNDALKDVSTYKGGFPAQYGGRLSSVIDIRMKDGNMENYIVEGGIGILSSNLTIQGPLIKNRMSFLLSGRRSYIDKVVQLIYKRNALPYYFYDSNFKLNYIVNDKDRIYLSAYYGDDILSAAEKSDEGFFDGGFKLGNFTTTLRWNRIYNPKLFSNISLIHTRFRYDVEANIPGNSFLAKSRISDYGIKIDYNYFYNPTHTIKYGGFLINHIFRPNVVNTAGEISEFVRSREGSKMNIQETGIYIGDEMSLDSNLKFYAGLRTSFLACPNKIYAGLEPRASLTWALHETGSLKFSYARMKQYLHLVSSSAAALPTDLWYPVSAQVKPLNSDQIAMGYNKHFPKLKLMWQNEVYYKWMRNMIDYREGAVLVLNDNYESELVTGKGWAYGFESFLSKTRGSWTGWIGYTLSWSNRHFPDLNKGEVFPAKYDKRHDFSIVSNWDLNKRCSFSFVWIYSTGVKFTPIIGNYFVPNSSNTDITLLPIYGKKNSYELPASHRLDLSFIIKSRANRKHFKHQGEWRFGFYNFYNRAQPQRIEISMSEKGGYKYQATGIFGTIPFIAYHFKL